MPLANVRYRVVRRGGKKIRLAFRKGTGTVIEAVNLDTGKAHTPAEFRRDRTRKKRRRQRR